MSKVSFRTRQIDFNRPLAIVKYGSDVYYELGEGTFINRGVPNIPSGMEREEENEHHFVEVINALQLQKSSDKSIPVPEIVDQTKEYEKLYTPDFSPPDKFIHIQNIALSDEDPVEYDMDTDDEEWLHRSDLNLDQEQFESMIDKLERGCGQRVMNLEEARYLLNDDPSLVIAVYDYWLNKRIQCRQPLLLSVRQEKRDGGSNNDPYVAFRRRTERMQTRKNRKNDEYSYEKMLILREQMTTLGEILSRLVKRDAIKESSIGIEKKIFEMRYKLEDWKATCLSEADLIAKKSPKPSEPLHNLNKSKVSSRKRKRSRRLDAELKTSNTHNSDNEQNRATDEDPFAFIRIPGCKYQRPLDLRTAPFSDENISSFRLSRIPQVFHEYRHGFTGYLRRRLGRGGRILFDRVPAPSEELERYFLDIDTQNLPAETCKSEIRQCVPLNKCIPPMHSEGIEKNSTLGEVMPVYRHYPMSDLTRRLNSFLLQPKRTGDLPLTCLANPSNSRSPNSHLQNNLIRNSKLIPDFPSHLQSKSFFLIPHVNNSKLTAPQNTNETFPQSSKASTISLPTRSPLSDAHRFAGKDFLPVPPILTKNFRTAMSKANCDNHMEFSLRQSEINGSKTGDDDLNWLSHINSIRKTRDCLYASEHERNEKRNSIIPANPLVYNI